MNAVETVAAKHSTNTMRTMTNMGPLPFQFIRNTPKAKIMARDNQIPTVPIIRAVLSCINHLSAV
jgi:hypothetical protein